MTQQETLDKHRQYAYDIRTLILKHEEAIERMTHRLDTMEDKHEPVAEMAKTQIEFIIINMEMAKQGKEQELLSVESQIKWVEANPEPELYQPFPPRPMGPVSMPAQSISPISPPAEIDGDKVVATRVYRSNKPGTGGIGSVVFLTASGKIMDSITTTTVSYEEWSPGEDWTLDREFPIPA